MKVMVGFREGDQGLTYETTLDLAVGDRVRVPYGNWREEIIEGTVVALGAQPRTLNDGSIEPAYAGPCKRVSGVVEGSAT